MAETNQLSQSRTEALRRMYAGLSGRTAMVGKDEQILFLSPAWSAEAYNGNTLAGIVGASAADWVRHILKTGKKGSFSLRWRGMPSRLTAVPAEGGLLLTLVYSEPVNIMSSIDLPGAEREMRETLSVLLAAEDSMRKTVSTEKGKKSMALLRRGLFHLMWLTDMIVDIGKYDREKLEISEQRIDLREVADRLLRRCATVVGALDVALEAQLPPGKAFGVFDRRQIERMLLSVLAVSLKAARSGGVIGFSMSVSADSARFTVFDRGMGLWRTISERVKNPETKTAELELARILAEVHGGRLMLESGAGERGMVHIQFPLKRRPEAFSTMRMEYGGGFDPILVELSGVLPWEFYR